MQEGVLLGEEHAPFSLDLFGKTIRPNLVVHTSDVFAANAHEPLVERVTQFIELVIELRQIALSGVCEELGGEGGEDAVVSGGVVAEGVLEFWDHEACVAGVGDEVSEAGEQFVATGVFGGEPGADARAQGDKGFAAQGVKQALVAGEDDAQQGLGVEAIASADILIVVIGPN